jgi:hypothetical protein
VPAAACGDVHFSNGDGEVQGYSIHGGGGQATVTITLTGAPHADQGPPPSTDGFYTVAWDADQTTYYAGLRVSPVPFPSASPVSQYTAEVGTLTAGSSGATYSADNSVAVNQSVDGSTITLTFPYGTEAAHGMGIANSGAYSHKGLAVDVDSPGVPVGPVGPVGPVPAVGPIPPGQISFHGSFNQTAAGTPSGSKEGTETGPGGNPFC